MSSKLLTFKSSTENLKRIRDFVVEEATNAGFSEDDVYKIELAVDEACTNVIKHAYKGDSSKSLSVELSKITELFIITITDSGINFNESTYHEPDLEHSIKIRKRGGLGIHLIKSFMDNVEFLRSGDQNILRMTKSVRS